VASLFRCEEMLALQQGAAPATPAHLCGAMQRRYARALDLMELIEALMTCADLQPPPVVRQPAHDGGVEQQIRESCLPAGSGAVQIRERDAPRAPYVLIAVAAAAAVAVLAYRR